jgi:small subunit ribosomal protein S5
VVEAAGIHDILSKSLGSDNVFNVVMATFKGLGEMSAIETRAGHRGKTAAELMPAWRAADVH